MREILSDLVAEEQHLDQFLQGISDRDWKKKTPAPGWTIQDQVGHLAHLERFAADILEKGQTVVDEARDELADFDAWAERGAAQYRRRRHQEVIEQWRFARADVVDALSRMEAADRVPWIYGDLGARTFSTMRLMETWAHGLDIKAAILGRIEPFPEDDLDEDEEDPLADTDRMRHIAWLGQRALPFAFEQSGEQFPAEGIRVELMGPKYAAWRFGPEDTDQVIKGMAGDWCRVVVRRQDASTTGLKAVGDFAEVALKVAKAY
jgi:uncharacterized protein (TIGR03084 family)